MSFSSLSGINIAANCNSGTGYDSFNIPDMRRLLGKGARHFRISMVSGTYTAGVNEAKQYVTDLAGLMSSIPAEQKTILFGISSNPFKSTTWAADVVRIKAAAQWAQLNGATQFCLANELDCNWNISPEIAISAVRSGNTITVTWDVPHGYITGETMQMSAKAPILNSTSSAVLTKIDDLNFSFTTGTAGSDGSADTISIRPSNGTIVTRLKTLATEVKALSGPAVTIPVVYATGQGHGSQWDSGLGNIDKLGFNIYGEVSTSDQARFDNFKSQVDALYAVHGSNMEVHEWNLHATPSSFPTNKDTQRTWIRQRYQYLEAKGIKHYFYKWRSDSHSGNQNDNHAAKYTWDVGGLADGGIRWLDIIARERPMYKDQ